MSKADNPFFHPLPVRFVSREGWVCLALVLAFHLLFAGWIGWTGFGEKVELTAPLTGTLVSGSGGMGGRSGERTGNGAEMDKKRPGKIPVAPARVRAAADKPFSGGNDARRVRENDRKSPEIAAGDAVSGERFSGVAHVEKTDTDGFTGRGNDAGAGAGSTTGPVACGSGNGGDETCGSGKGGNGSGSGGMAGPYADAGFFSNPKPPYPPVSRRMGEEGVVILSVYILADGRVADVKVKRSSGFARLDESALKTVRHWRYVPAKKDGRPVAFRYAQPIRFSLNE